MTAAAARALPSIRPASASEMQRNTVSLVITFQGIGNRRKVHTSQIEVDADKELIAVSKKLLDCDEYDAIQSIEGEARRYLDTRALPSLLKAGIVLLPLDLVPEVDAKLMEFQAKRERAVDAFVAVYPQRVAEASKRLGKLANDADYPDVDDVANRFGLEWHYMEFSTPGSLKSISHATYQREIAKTEKMWNDTRAEIQELLRLDMAEMIDHLAAKLEMNDKGKKKVFRDSAVTKLQDFLTVFDARNIAGDVELKKLVEQTKSLIKGVKPERLRTNEDLRQRVKDGFEKIADRFDDLIVEKPHRRIVLE